MKLGTYNYSTGEAFDFAGVLLGTFPNWLEARRAMDAARLPVEFWFSESIPPIPLLQQLNDWVIRQNEKRLPKWKFKFAPDLAIQIQPKLTRKHMILFECVAIRAEKVSVKYFTQPKLLEGSIFWKVGFSLFCSLQDTTVWHFKAKSTQRGHGCASGRLIELRRQIIDALHPEHFAHLSSDHMLSHACLCCGKELTDPVSIARWIGPECWGNGSVNIPRVFKAEAA